MIVDYTAGCQSFFEREDTTKDEFQTTGPEDRWKAGQFLERKITHIP